MHDPKASGGHLDSKFHLFLMQLGLYRVECGPPSGSAGAVVLEDEDLVSSEVDFPFFWPHVPYPCDSESIQ